MNFVQKLFKSIKIDKPTKSTIDTVSISNSIPNGWYVSEAGQDPLHMLWFVVLLSFDDVVNKVNKPRHFISEEHDSFEQALQECIYNCNQSLN